MKLTTALLASALVASQRNACAQQVLGEHEEKDAQLSIEKHGLE